MSHPGMQKSPRAQRPHSVAMLYDTLMKRASGKTRQHATELEHDLYVPAFTDHKDAELFVHHIRFHLGTGSVPPRGRAVSPVLETAVWDAIATHAFASTASQLFTALRVRLTWAQSGYAVGFQKQRLRKFIEWSSTAGRAKTGEQIELPHCPESLAWLLRHFFQKIDSSMERELYAMGLQGDVLAARHLDNEALQALRRAAPIVVAGMSGASTSTNLETLAMGHLNQWSRDRTQDQVLEILQTRCTVTHGAVRLR